ncbi:MAG: hypothetical protein B7Z33_05235 [Sphingomonadales bacterium 12-68-11]|nr:MAG: hypothetical protein B7Z33_05235 [Sphingomonadales bacterium 12-68-11]
MAATRTNGLRVIGVIFLLLGLFKFLNGTAWVVWIILGALAMAASKSDALTGANRDNGGQ